MKVSMSVIKCFSLLVASNQSDRCNELKNKLRDSLLVKDETTGLSKVYLHKFGLQSHREGHIRTGQEVAGVVFPMLKGIPDIFFGSDKQNQNPKEIS